MVRGFCLWGRAGEERRRLFLETVQTWLSGVTCVRDRAGMRMVIVVRSSLQGATMVWSWLTRGRHFTHRICGSAQTNLVGIAIPDARCSHLTRQKGICFMNRNLELIPYYDCRRRHTRYLYLAFSVSYSVKSQCCNYGAFRRNFSGIFLHGSIIRCLSARCLIVNKPTQKRGKGNKLIIMFFEMLYPVSPSAAKKGYKIPISSG